MMKTMMKMVGGDLGEGQVGGQRHALLTQQLLLLLRQLEFSVQLSHRRRRGGQSTCRRHDNNTQTAVSPGRRGSED